MSETSPITRSTDGPVTRTWLKRDLQQLGVKPGMLLMVHTGMSNLGWVIGGVVTVVAALREAVGEAGTLVMPTFTGGNNDPAPWKAPPVPESWWQAIRDEMPAFDPSTTPTREMGRVTEYFRTLPGTIRSNHPSTSWAAQGSLAEVVTANHGLSMCLGEDSPIGTCYKLGGQVLSLGCQRTTALHLAEYLADFPGKHVKKCASAAQVAGKRQWVEYDDIEEDDEDFEQLRQAFMAEYPAGESTWREGAVAYSTSRLFAVRPLVDFAVQWISANRK